MTKPGRRSAISAAIRPASERTAGSTPTRRSGAQRPSFPSGGRISACSSSMRSIPPHAVRTRRQPPPTAASRMSSRRISTLRAGMRAVQAGAGTPARLRGITVWCLRTRSACTFQMASSACASSRRWNTRSSVRSPAESCASCPPQAAK